MVNKNLEKGLFLKQYYFNSIKDTPLLVDENNNPTEFALEAKKWGERIPTSNTDIKSLIIKAGYLINKYSSSADSTVENIEKEESLSMLSQDKTPIILLSNNAIRVPLAKKGKWVHETYGKVAFDDKDYEDIVDNYKNNRLGFTPYITYGHIDEEHNSTGSERKRGNLKNIHISNDVIYGDFEVKEETYTAVKNGEYEYSSGEFLRNYVDKNTGDGKGTAHMRVALTNSPFIPFGDIKVQALSNSAVQNDSNKYFIMELSTSNEEKVEETIDNSNQELESLVETKVEEVEKIEIETKVEDLFNQINTQEENLTLNKEIMETPEQVKVEEVKAKVEEVAAPVAAPQFNLEEVLATVKETYAAQLKTAEEKFEAAQETVNKLVEQVTTLTNKLVAQETVTQAFSANMSKAAEQALYKRLTDAGVTPANVQKFSTLKSAIESSNLSSNVVKFSTSAGEESTVGLVDAIANSVVDAVSTEPVAYQQFGVTPAKTSGAGFEDIIKRNKEKASKNTLG